MNDLSGRTRWHSSSVSARLVGLVVVAAIPLLLMAGTIVWQNYRLAAGTALQHALLIREAQLARHEAVIDGTEQMLAALGQVQAVQQGESAACNPLLANVLAVNPGRYADVVTFDANGALRCQGHSLPADKLRDDWSNVANTTWFRETRDRRRAVLSPLAPSAAIGRRLLLSVVPIVVDGQFHGVLVAGMRVDWLNYLAANDGSEQASASWLIDRSRTAYPLGDATEAALPRPQFLDRLFDTQADAAEGVSRGGRPYAYASTHLTSDIGLLVGYPASRALGHARTVLFGRMAELGMLVLAGIIAVWFGGAVAVVDPIVQFSRAVVRWKDGGAFDPGPESWMPSELRRLSRVFGEATQSLEQRERQLQSALAQQELLMQEIHHRVKNNLQIVASLLNLQASRIRIPAARAEFQSARDRIRALATLHRHLYAHGELQTIAMRSFLTELCSQLFQAMGEPEDGRIKLDIEAPELKMTSDQAVPLALIVTEAVTNAVKYAFPGGRSGHVSVRLAVEGERLELTIQDDGVGIPAGRSETETGTRDGIGIQLIRGFARQLGAQLSVEEGSGTCYRVAMTLRPNRPASPDLRKAAAD